jgi:photosystem II stability/assembly factor-like uncharacterized protein
LSFFPNPDESAWQSAEHPRRNHIFFFTSKAYRIMSTFKRLGAFLSFSILSLVTLMAIQIPVRHDGENGGRIPLRSTVKAPGGFMRHAKMRSLFWEQRLTGNPDVNVFAEIWKEYSRLERQGRMTLDKAAFPNNVWQELGPWNIAGRIRALAVDPTNPNIMYAGAAAGGIWKTTDQGVSWFTVTDTLALLPVGAITVDPNNPRRIFAGTGEPCVDPVQYTTRSNWTPTYLSSLGILKSEDAGASWTLLPWPAPNNAAPHRITTHPTSNDTVLAATVQGLMKTSNGGKSWVNVSNGDITDVFYQPGNPSRVYMAIGYDNSSGTSGSNGVYVSDAGGAKYSFRRLAKNFPTGDSCGRVLIGMSAANPNRLYAAVALSRNKISVEVNDFFLFLVSTDAGETWERKINALSSSSTNGQAYYDMAMAVSPTDPNLIFFGGLDIFRSTNGGFTFTRLTNWTRQPTDSRFAHADHHSLVFRVGDGNTIFNGNDGGVSISSDKGDSWSRRLGQLGTIQFYSCTFDPTNPTFVYGGTQDNGSLGRTANNNAQWFEVFGGDGGNVAIDPKSVTTRYVVSTTASTRPIYRVISGTPKELGSGLNAGGSADRFNWIAPLMLHPSDRTFLYTASQFVYRMQNPDNSNPSWELISPELSPGIVTDLAVAPTNPERMYAATQFGAVWVCDNARKMDPTWVSGGTNLPFKWLTDITVDWDNADIAYVAVSGFGSGHAFKSVDRGKTWVNISGNLPNIPASAIVRSRADVNTLFLANDLGVWYTRDGGTNWERFGIGMPNVVVFDMKMTPDDRLLVATHGRGMWTTSAVTDVGGTPAAELANFSITEAYPNPASTATGFSLKLAKPLPVKAQIFDAAGRAVRTILEGTLNAGSHSLTVQTDGLRMGAYFCVVRADGGTITRKFLVVR